MAVIDIEHQVLGRIQAAPARPVCSLEAPVLTTLDSKRKLVQKIESAIAEAYGGHRQYRGRSWYWSTTTRWKTSDGKEVCNPTNRRLSPPSRS